MNYKKTILVSIVLVSLFSAIAVFSASQTVTLPGSPTGQFLKDDMTWATVSGSGTVTSVAMTVPTGLTISGSPITTDGTLALTLTPGYSIPLVDALTTGEQHDVTASVALTEVTPLSQTLSAGTYIFRYYVIYQSNQLTNGIRLAVNYTGTNGAFVWNWRWADLAATAATAVPDQDDIDATGNVVGTFQSRAKSTTSRGVTLSVDTINADMFIIIEGVFVATGAGDLELWHGSEVATAGYTTSVMIGTSVEIHKTK